MITEFCTSCGAKYEYSLKKPNFCSSCGATLGSSAQKNEPQENKRPEPEIIQASDDHLPNISKLEYSLNSSSNKVTFGDLVSEASRSDGEYKKTSVRPQAKYDPNEDVLKSTMDRCRSKLEPEDVGGEEK
jgi:hypothetical protein